MYIEKNIKRIDLICFTEEQKEKVEIEKQTEEDEEDETTKEELKEDDAAAIIQSRKINPDKSINLR